MTTEHEVRAAPRGQRILRGARLIFTPLSFLVIAFVIWQARASIAEMVRGGVWQYLLFALLLWVLSNVIAPLVSVQIFRAGGAMLAYRVALHIHASRLPAKYLPGGIWHSVGRANDYLELGYGMRQVGRYFMIENFLIIATTLTLSAGIVAPLVTLPELRLILRWGPLLLGAALLVFPALLLLLTHGRERIGVAAYLGGVGASCAYWLVVGLAFATYIAAFHELGLATDVVQTAAVYIFSWCFGYLALFAPQGIGVSELISGYLLADDRRAVLLLFLLGFRLLVLAGDLVSWGLALVLRWQWKGWIGRKHPLAEKQG
ncbi:MAG: hypothetical protein RLZZ227_314 [Pseudomonadota bacterium]|jgi:hypothetical protein